MCGLVSVISRYSNGFSLKEEDVFWEMLFADTLRGDDSTGIVSVHTDASFGIAKEAFAAPYVIDAFRQEEFNKNLLQKGKALIGHNRKATVGKIKADCAHPFVVNDTFALVHNGTLSTYRHLTKNNVEVDSEALAYFLSDVLNDDVTTDILNEKMGEIYGAYAIIAFNQQNNKLYAMRNKERPLYKIVADGTTVLVSEGGLGMWILGRNGIVKDLKCEPLKEHVLYIFDLDLNSVEEMEFTPKKKWASTSTTGTGHTVQGTNIRSSLGVDTKNSKYPLSKSEYKRMRKHLLFSRMNFYVDDYVEKSFPKTLEQGATDLLLLGENDSLSYDHVIHAEFNYADLPEGENRITERLFSGRIVEMFYNKETHHVEFWFDQVFPVPLLKKETNETKTNLH